MINCYLTGVQIPMESAYVLSRRDARDLHDKLKERVASLRRLVEQFSPLDEKEKPFELYPGEHRFNGSPKKHRLLCKAAADVLAASYPEVKLFIPWTDYQGYARQVSNPDVRSHPLFSGTIKDLNKQELVQAEQLGMRVLHVLDPKHALPRKTRAAIAVGIGILHRGRQAEEIVRLICNAASEGGNAGLLATTPDDLVKVRKFLSDGMVAQATENKDETTQQP